MSRFNIYIQGEPVPTGRTARFGAVSIPNHEAVFTHVGVVEAGSAIRALELAKQRFPVQAKRLAIGEVLS